MGSQPGGRCPRWALATGDGRSRTLLIWRTRSAYRRPSPCTAEELSIDAILDGIRAGRSWITESAAVELSFKVAAGDHSAGIGERLETCGEPTVVLAEICGVPSGTVSFHTDRGAVHQGIIAQQRISRSGVGHGAEEPQFVRIEVRHRDGRMAALTNPILLT